MADLIENSTNVVMGILISIVLVCSALVPVALDQISKLSEDYGSDVTQYTDMIKVIIIVVIISLIIGVVRSYTKVEAD